MSSSWPGARAHDPSIRSTHTGTRPTNASVKAIERIVAACEARRATRSDRSTCSSDTRPRVASTIRGSTLSSSEPSAARSSVLAATTAASRAPTTRGRRLIVDLYEAERLEEA